MEVNNPQTKVAAFTAPAYAGNLTFRLAVTDSFEQTATDTVNVTVRPPETWGAWADTGGSRGSGASREKEQASTSDRGNRQTQWVPDPEPVAPPPVIPPPTPPEPTPDPEPEPTPEPDPWGPWTRTGNWRGDAIYMEAEEERFSRSGNRETRWVYVPGA